MDRLTDPTVDTLLTRLDELVKWRPGAKGKYEDLHSAIARLRGSANHIILGRRGAGKTRLIDELKRAVAGQATHVICVGAEDVKELTYPDILIQILRTFLREFSALLEARAALFSRAWWKNLGHHVRHPLRTSSSRRERSRLRRKVTDLLRDLDALLAESEELEAEYARQSANSVQRHQEHELTLALGDTAGQLRSSDAKTQEARDSWERKLKQREVKRVKVERLLVDFKDLLNRVSSHLNSRLILTVDDFYFIQRADQPKVIDYIHRICKDTNAFLKVATIKHRSQLFEHDSVSRGVVLGHEIQPINLELTLGHFESISKFLRSIWDDVCEEVGIPEAESIFMGDGLDQAVLASGGVPRDFFGVAKAAIVIARERGERGVGKRRVNEGARQYTEDTKMPELTVDIEPNKDLVDLLLFDIVRFVRDEKKKNCFHIDVDRLQAEPMMQILIDALVDSRLLHLITENTSNAKRSGRYAAYLLDVGLYGHPERRGDSAIEEIQFWIRDDSGRLKNLERSPVYPLRSLQDLQQAAATLKPHSKEFLSAVMPPPDAAQGPAASSKQYEQLTLQFPPMLEIDPDDAMAQRTAESAGQ